jgi:uncharacterized protein
MCSMVNSQPLVLLLPGWLNSGPTHWQSLWQARHGYTRVEQHDWQRPLRGDWQARLDEVIANHLSTAETAPSTALSKDELLTQQTREPLGDLASKTTPSIVLVAHSLGCHLVAAWASASRHTAAVRGALLVAPPDVTREDFPPDMFNWRKPILQPLPFHSICVVSGNDPFGSLQASQQTAAAWGARCMLLGDYGHINGESGLGDWPAGHDLLLGLLHNHTKI